MKLPNGISRVVGRQVLVLKKHAPALMFTTGAAGTVLSTVLACKATLKLEEKVFKYEDRRREMESELRTNPKYTTKDYGSDVAKVRVLMARDFTKLYAPAIGVGVLSLGLLTGAHITLTKRNAALIAAYNLLDKGFKEYRARVRDELGDDKDREFFFGSIEKEIVEEGEHGHEIKQIKRVGKHSVYARPFDDNNPCWSQSALNNRSFLTAQQNYLNDLLQSRGHVLLNDAYDLLKMERSIAGTQVGWVKGHGDDMVDFGLYNPNDPVMRDFMMLEHNDGIMIDFNVDGVVYDLIGKKF